MGWTEEKVEKLKELWGKGNTASQIAEIIGGISRNAVIGKAHRLNLSSKIKKRGMSLGQNIPRNNANVNQNRVPVKNATILNPFINSIDVVTSSGFSGIMNNVRLINTAYPITARILFLAFSLLKI